LGWGKTEGGGERNRVVGKGGDLIVGKTNVPEKVAKDLHMELGIEGSLAEPVG